MSGANSAHKYQDLTLFQPAQIIAPKAIPTGGIAQIWPATGQSLTNTSIDHICITNQNNAAEVIEVRLRAATGAGTAANDIIFFNAPAQSTTVFTFPKGMYVPIGSALWANAAATLCSIEASGGVDYTS